MHPYSRGALKNQEILLANSSEQNLCEKICSYRGAKLDENRTSTPTNSTVMQSIGAVCRLVVISPAVSGHFRGNPSDVGQLRSFGRRSSPLLTLRPLHDYLLPQHVIDVRWE